MPCLRGMSTLTENFRKLLPFAVSLVFIFLFSSSFLLIEKKNCTFLTYTYKADMLDLSMIIRLGFNDVPRMKLLSWWHWKCYLMHVYIFCMHPHRYMCTSKCLYVRVSILGCVHLHSLVSPKLNTFILFMSLMTWFLPAMCMCVITKRRR